MEGGDGERSLVFWSFVTKRLNNKSLINDDACAREVGMGSPRSRPGFAQADEWNKKES